MKNIKDKIRQASELLLKLNLSDIEQLLNISYDLIISISDNTEYKLNSLAITLKNISIENNDLTENQLCCIYGDEDCNNKDKLPKC